MSLRRRINLIVDSFTSRLTTRSRSVDRISVAVKETESSSQAPFTAQVLPNLPDPLLDLPEVIIFIILSHLPCEDLVRVSATCKALRQLINIKTVWLDALSNMKQKRPVPISYRNLASRGTTAGLPLEDVRAAVILAAKLEKKWSQEVIKPSRYHRICLLEQDGRDQLLMAWNLDVGRYLMTYSMLGWFTCTIIESGQKIQFKTRFGCCCWDFDFDIEGITIVFNAGEFDPSPCMEVYRIDLKNVSWKLMTTSLTNGNILSDFLEDDIAGCILSSYGDHPTLSVHVVNWKTGKGAIIHTGVDLNVNLSASTTKKSLLFCSGTIDTLDAWMYDFAFLKECATKAESPDKPHRTEAPPQYHFHTQYIPQGITKRPIVPWSLIMTTRGMWTGRQCIWSYFPGRDENGGSFLFALIADENTAGTQRISPENSSSAGITKEFKSISRRTFIYNPSEGTTILDGLYAMGHSGKHAVWIEDTGGDLACRLATFNPEDDSEDGPVATTFSTISLNGAEGFQWKDVTDIEVDDNAGIVCCVTKTDVWNLYFDA